MARTARLYVPLSVGFFDDDLVVAAGEKAGWLYLAMLTRIKQQDGDGLISRQQIGRLNVPSWQRRLSALLEYGLVEQVGGQTYRIPGWSKWNESSDERAERLARDRDRKAKSRGTDSGRNPEGVTPDSALKEERKEGSNNPTTSVVTQLSTVGGGA